MEWESGVGRNISITTPCVPDPRFLLVEMEFF